MERIAACVILLLVSRRARSRAAPAAWILEQSQALDDFEAHFEMFAVLRRFQSRNHHGKPIACSQ